MALAHGLPLGRLHEPLGREPPDGLQQPVVAPALVVEHQRLVDQAAQQVDDLRLGDGRHGAHPLGQPQVERPGEHRQPAQQHLLLGRQQVVAPLDGGAQRALPGRRGALAGGQQREAVVEPVRDLLGAEQARTGPRPAPAPAAARPAPGTAVRRQAGSSLAPVRARPRRPARRKQLVRTPRRTAPPSGRSSGGTRQTSSPRCAAAPGWWPGCAAAGQARQQRGGQRRRTRRPGARSCPAAAGSGRRRAAGPPACPAAAGRPPRRTPSTLAISSITSSGRLILASSTSQTPVGTARAARGGQPQGQPGLADAADAAQRHHPRPAEQPAQLVDVALPADEPVGLDGQVVPGEIRHVVTLRRGRITLSHSVALFTRRVS